MATDRALGVQFRGVENVVGAYHSMRIAPWAISCGPNLIEAYEGNNLEEGATFLTQFLDSLASNQSNAYYTLGVYDVLPKDGKIRIKTEPSRSFKFMLSEDRFQSPANRQLMERLDRIEAKMTVEMDAEEAELEKPSGIGAVLAGLWERPEVQAAISGVIAGFLDKYIMPIVNGGQMKTDMGQPAAIGSTGTGEADQLEKVQQAVAVLWNVDKKLGDHLSAVAKIASENPGKYKMLISML